MFVNISLPTLSPVKKSDSALAIAKHMLAAVFLAIPALANPGGLLRHVQQVESMKSRRFAVHPGLIAFRWFTSVFQELHAHTSGNHQFLHNKP